VQELVAILRGLSPAGQLDLAALEVATLEHPGLDPGPSLAVLDKLAAELGRRVSRKASGDEFIAAAQAYLFNELGFTGEEANYYDAGNSCLNDVLETHRGLPITLSVVYMEVARRLGRKVHGVGLPGHFVVRYEDSRTSAWLDPYHGGRRVTAEDCFALAREATGGEVPEDYSLLAPITHRQILLRMLNNLRRVYFHRRSYRKALALLDFLLDIFPDSAEDYKQRAIAQHRLRRTHAARADFERYLE
jgi:regulator of sirC expression with transglutaminase-like and TPR domain